MLKYDLQLFGGNGASTPDGGSPGGGGDLDGEWTGSVGGRVYETAAEALGTQGRAMGVEKATLGANPNYSPEYREYSENCQRCVQAYEARRRGYDVVAHPTYNGDTMPSGNNWTNGFVEAKTESIASSTRKAVQNKLDKKMAEYGEGSRAVVSVQWSGANFGHVINVERKGGKTIYRDAQTGVQYKGNNFFKNVNPKSVSVTRVDNLPFSDAIGQAVTKDRL